MFWGHQNLNYSNIPSNLLEAVILGNFLNYDMTMNDCLMLCSWQLPVQVTLVSAFVFPHWPPSAINVFFAFVILFIAMAHLLLVSILNYEAWDVLHMLKYEIYTCINFYALKDMNMHFSALLVFFYKGRF